MAVAFASLVLPTSAVAAPAIPTGLNSTGSNIPILAWSRVAGAREYRVQGSETDSFSTLVFDVTTTNVTYVPIRVLKSGSLYWRVTAGDGSGWGPVSQTAQFDVPVVAPPGNVTVSGGLATSPPVKPPVVRWNAVPKATGYTLQMDNEGDEVVANEYSNIRGTSYVIPRPQALGDYFVRVRANFDNGLQTTFSPWVKYDVDRLPDVTSASCAAGLVCAPGPQSGIRPSVSVQDVVLDWDPIPGATQYEVWVAKDLSFNTTIEGPRRVYGSRYSPERTYDNAPYFWKVRAINAAGEAMPWPTTPSQFQRDWPNQPVQVYPPNAASPAVGDDLYYQWTPVKHASRYQLDVGTDANFTPNSYRTCYTASTTYTPGYRANDFCMPSQGVLTYWRVKPLDAYQHSAVEGIYSDAAPAEPDYQGGRFVYDSGQVNLQSPANGSTVDTPTLRWAPSNDAQQYDVIVRESSGAVAAQVVTSALSWTPYDRLDPARGPFTWTVAAVDGDGKRSPRYTGRTFALNPTPTVTADRPDPLPGVSETVTARFPQLRWAAVTGAKYYRVRVAEAGYVFPDSASDILSRQLRYPSVTDPGTFFLRPGEFTWWVEAFTEAGASLGTGNSATFTITRPDRVSGHALALDGLALDTDAAGGGKTSCTAALANAGAFCDGVPATPVLDWAPTAGAGGYLVYLSLNRAISNRVLEPYAVTTNSRWTPSSDDLRALADNEAQEAYFWFIRPCVSVNPIINCAPDPANQTDSATHAFRKVSPRVVQTLPIENSIERGSEITFSWEGYRATNARATFAGGAASSHQSAKSYRLQVSQSQTITDANTIEDVTVDQATYTSWRRTYPEGDLWWRVQAIDEKDNRLAWSETRKFVRATPALNLDPGFAAPNERASGDSAAFPAFNSHLAAGSTQFAWSAYDFDGTWQLEVYKNNDTTGASGNLVFRSSPQQAAYVSDDTLPASSEAYRWRVKRIDVYSNEAGWSDWGRFFVDPAQPVLDSPAEGSVQAPNGPVLAWQSLAGARNYRVRLLSSGGDEIQTENTYATAWAVPRTLTTGTYRWQVVALDLSGRQIGVSERTFIVNAQLAPTSEVQIHAPAGTGVGSTLTSTPPVWNQTDVEITYQWLRDGGRMWNQTQPTYTLTVEDFGKDISLSVTGKRASYADGTSVSNVIRTTAGGALQATVQPTITGAPTSGTTLWAGMGTWTQPGPTLKYQWLRTGAPIPGATNGYYTLTPADAGKDVSVTVLASKAGFADGSATAASVFVAKLKSTTTSTLSTTRIKKGKTVKVGVTVTIPGVATPAGTIKIQDGVKTLKTFVMDPFRKGVMAVKLSTKKLKPGRHKIKLVYLGNASTDMSRAKTIRLIVLR